MTLLIDYTLVIHEFINFFFYLVSMSLYQSRFNCLGGLSGILFDDSALIRGLE